MPIDLTDRIIQPPPKKAVKLHPLRRLAQVALGVLLVVLPLINWLRVDVTRGRFWILGQSFTAQNMILLFYICALGAVVLLSVSMVYGRWWCGWICPQTLASDFGDSLKTRIDLIFRASLGPAWGASARVLWTALMLVMAVVTAAVVCTYFYPASRVWISVFHPLSDHRVSSHLAIIAGVIGADLLWVRRHFCRRGCPYGLMLSLIGDKNTMTVRYLWERDDDCISCGQCVTVCPMSIDIKHGANQMECIGCGECIDACNDILPMIKSAPKAGLIELRYGLDPMRVTSRLNVFQKLGLWDARRYFLCGVVLLLFVGFYSEMFGSRATTITIVPSGTITQSDGCVFELYDLNIINGNPKDTSFTLSASGIDKMFLFHPGHVIRVARSGQKTVRITLAAPSKNLSLGQRYPINVTVQSLDSNQERRSVATIFYIPEQSTPLKAG